MTGPEQTEKQADDKQDLRAEEVADQVADLEAEPSDVDDVKGGPWSGEGMGPRRP